MAILGMDQYAYLIASRLDGAVITRSANEIDLALNRGEIPVLAPSHWVRTTDPLPHVWDVTSDSIAAWVAGCAGATQLVLIKPPGAHPSKPANLVDAYFARTLPAQVRVSVVAADQIDTLQLALRCTKAEV
jgi:aspartokinase-like uncharacterized kinase